MTNDSDRISVRLVAVVVIVALLGLSALVAAATMPALAQDSGDDEECQTTIVHDELRNDEIKIDELANGSEVQSTELNTRVYYREDNRFYKITGQNPNGYCVRFDVRISREAIPTADLPGKVTSNGGDHEATWRSVADFDDNTTYSRIQFTLPGNTSATFAPSADRVQALAWASAKRNQGEGILDSISQKLPWNNRTLEQRHYEIAPGEETEVAVPLQNESTGQEINDWKALYREDPNSDWRPITQDVEAPVYYRYIGDDDQTIQFVFNNATAQVKFMANPSTLDTLDYEIKSYQSSWSDLIPDLPFQLHWDPYLGGI